SWKFTAVGFFCDEIDALLRTVYDSCHSFVSLPPLWHRLSRRPGPDCFRLPGLCATAALLLLGKSDHCGFHVTLDCVFVSRLWRKFRKRHVRRAILWTIKSVPNRGRISHAAQWNGDSQPDLRPRHTLAGQKRGSFLSRPAERIPRPGTTGTVVRHSRRANL